MRTSLTNRAAFLGIAGMTLLVCGCSDSGANSKTTVVIKPSTTDSGNGDATKDGNGGGDAAAVAEGFGTFKGRVVLQGTAPQLPLLVRQGSNIKDAEVCAAQNIPSDRLVVSGDGGVANVFVYLAKAPAGAKPSEPSADPILFDQKGCRFMPHALAIRVGQPLQIVSGDAVPHNTNISTLRGTPFNQIIQPNDRKGAMMKFSTYENQPVPVRCDFHGWMSAWQLPLEHPFVAVSNENGEFEIPNLPAGKHRFSVWHEGAGFLNRANLDVTVKADATVELEVPYPAEKFKP